jgi:sporulation protein YlmC with PRC-barrel domain
MAQAPAKVLNTASPLELMRVETVDGKQLGHLFDLRCQWRTGQSAPVLTEIVCGRRGLLEHLGLRDAHPTTVPWTAVQAIEGRVITVANVHRPRGRKARRAGR